MKNVKVNVIKEKEKYVAKDFYLKNCWEYKINVMKKLKFSP
jgi:hypothetical protein